MPFVQFKHGIQTTTDTLTGDAAIAINSNLAAIASNCMFYRGQWLANTAYELNDVVTNNGQLFLCIQPVTTSTGSPADPTNGDGTYWRGFASEGPISFGNFRISSDGFELQINHNDDTAITITNELEVQSYANTLDDGTGNMLISGNVVLSGGTVQWPDGSVQSTAYLGNGASGYSGFSGKSGFSGFSGATGPGGIGFSGAPGVPGVSGTSGFSGVSGKSGYSGQSGLNGLFGASGAPGASGYSGYSGAMPTYSVATLTSGSSITWSATTNGPIAKLTLATNATLATVSSLSPGTYVLLVTQDTSGSRTLAYSTAYKWPGGTAPTLSTAANSTDVLTFISDGTNLYGSALKAFA